MKAAASRADFFSVGFGRICHKTAFLPLRRSGRVLLKSIRKITDVSFVNRHTVHTVSLIVLNCENGAVDRYLMKIRPSEPCQLSIKVGEKPALQQGVFGKVDARYDIGGAECCLLRFGKEVVNVPI
jgi:hypothetical protein